MPAMISTMVPRGDTGPTNPRSQSHQWTLASRPRVGLVTRARYPFIDVHNHQFGMPDQDLSELTAEMDKLNMAVMVNLSGRGDKDLDTVIKALST